VSIASIFLYFTTTDQLWPGSLKSTLLRYLGSEGKGSKIQGKRTFPKKLVLSWRRGEDSASRTETFGDFPRANSSQTGLKGDLDVRRIIRIALLPNPDKHFSEAAEKLLIAAFRPKNNA
jgi:hypothetical protein